jgi:hypothetical protein
VRTGGLLEPFGKGVPFLGVAVKPWQLLHVLFSAQITILPEWGEAG